MTAVVYSPAIDGEFVLDDYQLVGDPLIRDPFSHDVSTILAGPRPLAMATFVLNRLVSGLDSRAWHITNTAIHLGVVSLAFLFVLTTYVRAGLPRPQGPALAAVALFALHPLQTQPVAYITQRSEVLASGFVIAALLVLLARDEATTPFRRAALLAGAAVLQAFGLLAKPIAATVPVLWLLHAAILPSPGEEGLTAWRRAARRIPAAIPLLALAAFAAARGLEGASGSMHAGFSIPNLPAADYLATQLRVIPTYLRLFVWPVNQCAEWGFPPSRTFFDPRVLAGGAFLAALAVAAIVTVARVGRAQGDGPAAARAAGLGLLFFFAALAPTSLVPLVDVIAEHRPYLGVLALSAGVMALATAVLRRVAPTRALAFGAALASVVALAAGVAATRRSALWISEASLLTDAVGKTPEKARLQMNLGYSLLRSGRPDEALRRFELASKLAADNTVDGMDLAVNVINALIALGRIDDARARLGWLLRKRPNDTLALALLAQVEYAVGRDDAAEQNAIAALRVDGGNGIAHKYYGLARLRRSDPRTALVVFRAVARANVVDPELFEALAIAEERTGHIAAACSSFEIAAGQPGDPRASERARAARTRLACR